ncbi:DedA family protein [bacterium]|nr:DedA family protein [bacterium]MBU1152557.1 DedA family protein [bacterium]MBU2600062.1 DedA family protein [bacterium]
MVKTILGILSAFIIWVISSLGYWGIILTMAIESACIPLPSEIIMPFGGYLVATKVFVSKYGEMVTLFYVGLAGAFGCVVGSVVAYWVGVWGGRPFLEKYGHYVLMSKHDLDLADKWFNKYGDLTIFTSRLLPVIRTFISLPAGIAKMNFNKFLIYTFTGSVPWCWALGFVGYKIGQHAKTIAEWEHGIETKLGCYLHIIDAAILVIIILLVIWFIKRHLRH